MMVFPVTTKGGSGEPRTVTLKATPPDRKLLTLLTVGALLGPVFPIAALVLLRITRPASAEIAVSYIWAGIGGWAIASVFSTFVVFRLSGWRRYIFVSINVCNWAFVVFVLLNMPASAIFASSTFPVGEGQKVRGIMGSKLL